MTSPTRGQPYRIPSTIQSFPQWRTVRRSGVAVRIPERNVRVIWLTGKIHIWKDRQRQLWWMRCDHCVTRGSRAFAVSVVWERALVAATRHAALHHGARL